MSQLVIYAALLTQLVYLSVVAGAPSQREFPGPAVTSSSPSAIIQHPKEEMELENLKHFSTADKTSGEKAQNYTSGNTESVTKPPGNQEHPAPSDNNNDNTEKFFTKNLSIRSSPLSFEEKIAADLMDRFSYKVNTDYTPQDIAEYIFWTGDEQGVALALNDFLQDDMVANEDLLRFLDDVKLELNILRNRYARMVETNQGSQSFMPAIPLDISKLKSRFTQPQYYLGKEPAEKRDMAGIEAYPSLETTRNYIDSIPISDGQRSQSFYSSGEDSSDYEEIFEKLRQNDPKFRETSLREIIYELARELFAQELTDKPTKSLQRFAHFLENESAMGRIPKDLSKTVLDTLVGALVDAVTEQAKTWKPTQISAGGAVPSAAISLTKSKITPEDSIKQRNSAMRKQQNSGMK